MTTTAKPTVVSLGIHIVDILGRHVTEIPPGQGVDILDEIRITVAGTAAATSVDLAKLGANVIAMGAIGSDELGNFVVSTMDSYGIDIANLVRKGGVPTSATMLPIRPNGERPALHVFGANGELTLDDINFDVIANADYLHLGGTSVMAKFDGPPSVNVLKFAKEKGVITTFDLVAVERPDLMELIDPLLPYIDYFMPGLEEAEMMTGLTERQDVINYFLDRGVGTTVFTMGAEGSTIANKELQANGTPELRIPAFETTVVDSTGCGDSYCAGFIVAHANGWSLEDVGKLGSACGAQVITRLGSDAGIVDLDSTIAFMKSTPTLPLSA